MAKRWHDNEDAGDVRASGAAGASEAANEAREARAAYARRRRARRVRFPCPTCKRPGAIGAWEKQRGYQCRECTLREEGLFPGGGA